MKHAATVRLGKFPPSVILQQSGHLSLYLAALLYKTHRLVLLSEGLKMVKVKQVVLCGQNYELHSCLPCLLAD